MKKFFTLLSLLVIGVVFTGCTTVEAYDAFVTIDINPSVALVVNQRDKVVEVEALNEDGEILLIDLELIGLDLEEAIDILLDTAIGLGFINPDEDLDIQVDVVALGDRIRERVQSKVQDRLEKAMQHRELAGQVKQREYSEEEIAEAAELGIEVRELRMIKIAAMRDETRELRDLAKAEFGEWMEQVKNQQQEMKEVVQALREEFFVEREALFAEYRPLIQDLEAQIEEAITNEQDTTELEAALEALKAELHEAFEALRADYLEQSTALKAEIMEARMARIQEHKSRVQQYANRMRGMGRDFGFDPDEESEDE